MKRLNSRMNNKWISGVLNIVTRMMRILKMWGILPQKHGSGVAPQLQIFFLHTTYNIAVQTQFWIEPGACQTFIPFVMESFHVKSKCMLPMNLKFVQVTLNQTSFTSSIHCHYIIYMVIQLNSIEVKKAGTKLDICLVADYTDKRGEGPS